MAKAGEEKGASPVIVGSPNRGRKGRLSLRRNNFSKQERPGREYVVST
jgi:hypothetical protein